MRLVKKDPPSFMDVIKAALLSNPATAGMTALASSAVREGKERLAENLRPLGYERYDVPRNEAYDEEKHLTGPADRLINALMGESEYTKMEQENPSESLKERQALFRTVLGLEGDTLPASEYMEGAYRSPVTEKALMQVFNDPESYYSKHSRIPRSQMTLESVIDEMTAKPHYHGPDISQYGQSNVLGRFTVSRGSDERGDYIDYYDEWDLNPFSDRPTDGMPELRGLEDFVYDNVLGLKSPKIYGRIYMDQLNDKGSEVPRLLRDLSHPIGSREYNNYYRYGGK